MMDLRKEHLESLPMFESDFGWNDQIETDCEDDDGTFYVARLEMDENMLAPWIEHDGHGPVSDWRNKDSKAPGERVLCTDRNSARFYDVQEATKIAKRDGWTCTHEHHRTPGEKRACAVATDYEYLRDWCEDRWHWVGVVLAKYQLTNDGLESVRIDDHVASIWGIDSNDRAYLREIANDLLVEARSRA